MKHTHKGGCHCGNVSISFATDKPREALAVRRCTCSFCAKHGAFHTADPAGRVALTFQDPAQVKKYRFGLGTADFLICRNCATYVGALFEDGGDTFAVVNVNIFNDTADWPTPQPKSFDGEEKTNRHARRRATWTPVAEVV